MSGVTSGSLEVSESGGSALKLQTDTPHLVSMGGDRLSTSVTLHPIPPGRVTLGSRPGVDIPVQGTGVLPLHCHIENSEGIVTLYPLSENISIDGLKVCGPTRLSQGVMLTIGRSNYMRFNHPTEARLMKSVLPNPRISMAPITFEPDNSFQNKFNKKPPTVPKKGTREYLLDNSNEEPPSNSNIMMKVSKFEYLAAQNFKKSISPKVFSSNLITVNTPAKDVLGKAPPDLQNFTKNLPQSALNYSELNHNEKHQFKTSERPIFGKKLPQYVNVTLNETKNINNRVIIYENGCIPKNYNVNFDHNELNTKSSISNKNVNVNRVLSPSPTINRNASPVYSSTPTSMSNNSRNDSAEEISNNSYMGSLEDLAQRKSDAELLRNQAQEDRIKEQQIEKAEQARLEEILSMCAEYEMQVQCEKNKLTPNRIITNGSLPRDKRQFGGASPSYGTPPSSPRDFDFHQHDYKHNNHSYENINTNYLSPKENSCYENVGIRSSEKSKSDLRPMECSSPYENVGLAGFPQSPRTRIKTFLNSSKDNCSTNSPKEPNEIIENKFSILKDEQHLLQNLNKSKEMLHENEVLLHPPKKPSPSKFILPLEETEESCIEVRKPQEMKIINDTTFFNFHENHRKASNENKISQNEDQAKVEKLRKEKKEVLGLISRVKRQMTELKMQEEELHRELELEKALLSGEHKSKLLDLEKIEMKKEKLLKRAQKIEDSMRDCQIKQDQDQRECREKLQKAQECVASLENKLSTTVKSSSEYEQIFEDYLKAQEILDNERKTFEDLEFHHLEEEADWLASREELQREIVDLSNKIEGLKEQIQNLEEQKSDLSSCNMKEFKLIEKQRLEFLIRLEEVRNRLKIIDNELSMYSIQESDQEVSSDSESDKSKDLEKCLSNLSLNVMQDLTCSIIISNTKLPIEHSYNMSQSFNEKLFQEKSVLEGGISKKFPSQDDIDRISKVTSNAPIDIDEQRGSLGRKTIESLKDIQRNRHLHLCQQGSQVIEQERQRVLALKQRVQEEVKSKWAQRSQNCSSYTSSGSEEAHSSTFASTETDQKNDDINSTANDQDQAKSLRSGSEGAESPRPMSEISELSMEVGHTLDKKRLKSTSDKQRPLTRYLPIRGSDLDLRQHIESAGHQVVLCPHVLINSNSCRGFLHKKGSKLNGWSKRWFVFDRNKHTFTYYADKSEKKPRGGAYFQAIEEVYLDHLNSVKSPSPQLTFIVKTHERFYYLMAPSLEAMRIWVDVIFTGAEGYQEFEHGT